MSSLNKIERLAMLNSAISTIFWTKFDNSNRNHSNPLQLYLFLNLVEMASFSIASLFIFLEEDIENIKGCENYYRFWDYAKMNGFLSLFRNGMDGFP